MPAAIFLTLLFSECALGQVHFQFTANTGENGVIAIPAAVAPNINSTALIQGDEIGAFNASGLCVGAVVWTGANLALTIWGDDPITTAPDGMIANEAISFRLWRQASDMECMTVTCHFSDNNDLYAANCIKELDTLDGHMILIKTKLFLQGPFSTGPAMTTLLQQQSRIPLTSPYTDAARTVTAIPAGVVDWIWIGLSGTPSGPILSRASFLLRADGQVVDVDATTSELAMPTLPAGVYYLHIKHRNHSTALSSSALTLSDTAGPLYDFGLSAGQYHNGQAVQLAAGIWGLATGDLNQDAFLTTSDYVILYNARRSGQTGYDQADLNLDGVIDDQDMALLYENIRLAVPVAAGN